MRWRRHHFRGVVVFGAFAVAAVLIARLAINEWRGDDAITIARAYDRTAPGADLAAAGLAFGGAAHSRSEMPELRRPPLVVACSGQYRFGEDAEGPGCAVIAAWS